MSENTHDPLCPAAERLGPCHCHLIARVVERERRLARERVLARRAKHERGYQHYPDNCHRCIGFNAAADAAGGGE